MANKSPDEHPQQEPVQPMSRRERRAQKAGGHESTATESSKRRQQAGLPSQQPTESPDHQHADSAEAAAVGGLHGRRVLREQPPQRHESRGHRGWLIAASVLVMVSVSAAAVALTQGLNQPTSTQANPAGEPPATGPSATGDSAATTDQTPSSAARSVAASSRPATTGVPFPTKCPVSRILEPSCGVYWGIYSRRYGDADPYESATTWEQRLGRKFNIVLMYFDFFGATKDKMFPGEAMSKLGDDRILLIDWETKDFDTGEKLRWADIAAGKYDKSLIIPQARKVKEYGRPIMLGIDHEMDLSFERDNHGSPVQYVAMYRHIRTVFRQQRVSNVIWTWVPTGYVGTNQYGDNGKLMKRFYPGNTWVDWIGYDPYNFHSCTGSRWKTFKEAVDPFYRWTTENGITRKPLLLQEYGTVYTSTNRPRSTGWYADIAPTLKQYPRIKAMVRWDSDTSCTLRIDSGTGMVDAFKKAGLAVRRP